MRPNLNIEHQAPTYLCCSLLSSWTDWTIRNMKTLDSLGKGRQDCLPMNSDGGLDRRTMSLPSLRGGEWERAGFRNSRLPPPQPSAFLSANSTAIISSPQPSSPWPLSLRSCYCGPLFLSAYGSRSRNPEGCLRIILLRNSGKL